MQHICYQNHKLHKYIQEEYLHLDYYIYIYVEFSITLCITKFHKK